MNITNFKGKLIVSNLTEGEYILEFQDFKYLEKTGSPSDTLISDIKILSGEAEGVEISVYHNIPKTAESEKDKTIAKILVSYFKSLNIKSFNQFSELIGKRFKAFIVVKKFAFKEYYNLANITLLEEVI